jgi:hypothetical protein
MMSCRSTIEVQSRRAESSEQRWRGRPFQNAPQLRKVGVALCIVNHCVDINTGIMEKIELADGGDRPRMILEHSAADGTVQW